MELTIDQALQQGVASHKVGKLQDAERLYRAILQSQPNHPDANHNLGVLAVAVGRTLEALPLFKKALDSNPSVHQFWLSYIDALIKVDQVSLAKQVLADAQQAGFDVKNLSVVQEQLKQILPDDNKKVTGGLKRSESTKRIAARKKKKKKKKAADSSFEVEPTQHQIDLLADHYQTGRFSEAEMLAASLTAKFPRHPYAWKILGIVFRQTGRLAESLAPKQTAVDLEPLDAENHNNLGNTLHALGDLERAEASFKQAIKLRPEFAFAHNNLGNTLGQAERWTEAEECYRTAISCKPGQAEFHGNLAILLSKVGRYKEAVPAFFQALTLKPDFSDAYANLAITLEKVEFETSNPALYPCLTNLLMGGNFVRPMSVARAILSLLKNDALMQALLANRNSFATHMEVTLAIETLEKLPLLHQLMRLCPLPDLQLEGFFVDIRRAILKNRGKLEESQTLLNFLSTLSLHCFINEYIYFEDDDENLLVCDLELDIASAITSSQQPRLSDLLCLASYRPLQSYEWCNKIELPDQHADVKIQLIDEPVLEMALARRIGALDKISDTVSCKVKQQYEDNPYPRWMQTKIPSQKKTISQICDEIGLEHQDQGATQTLAPRILVAGCGTGQHSISTATRFLNCQVTAIDLSLASLAYALRKTKELDVQNLDYLQADILDLHKLDKEFDVVECVGVLHHMDDPKIGWRTLRDLVKPGGLMRIGLYSEAARRNVTEARTEIMRLGIGNSAAEIRAYRQSLLRSKNEYQLQLTNFPDFYSLSELRDLIFHVQEHLFTITSICSLLDELGLRFCGFDNKNVVSEFERFYGEEADKYDLAAWRNFESSNPDTFIGMYQFWCQKE